MAHKVETMAYAGELPWHGLGYEVSNDLTPDEMMKAAKLDWEVRKQPTFTLIDDKPVDTGKSALIRSSDNKILDVISNDWNPTQNKAAFDFFHEFVTDGHMNMETAGSLDGGRNVWALAKINKSFAPIKDDVIEGYLLFSNPHKYGRAITVRFTPIRVVCNNTLTFALSDRLEKNMSVSVNHAKKFDPEMVKETLGIADHKLKEYEETAVFLSSKKFDQESLKKYITEIFPTTSEEKEISRPAETVLSVVETQPGAEFGRGTWWQAFNAITFAADHKLGRANDTRLNSAWFGINANRKQVALKKAVDYAKIAA